MEKEPVNRNWASVVVGGDGLIRDCCYCLPESGLLYEPQHMTETLTMILSYMSRKHDFKGGGKGAIVNE